MSKKFKYALRRAPFITDCSRQNIFQYAQLPDLRATYGILLQKQRGSATQTPVQKYSLTTRNATKMATRNRSNAAQGREAMEKGMKYEWLDLCMVVKFEQDASSIANSKS